MKNARLKRLSKFARKQIRNQIRLSLVMKLTELAGKFQDSVKFKRVIGKSAKKLSKKISKKLNIDILNTGSFNQSNDDSVQQMSDEIALNRTKSNVLRANKIAVLVKKGIEPPVGIS